MRRKRSPRVLRGPDFPSRNRNLGRATAFGDCCAVAPIVARLLRGQIGHRATWITESAKRVKWCVARCCAVFHTYAYREEKLTSTWDI